MTRVQRRVHVGLWLVLGAILGAGFIGAMLVRPAAPAAAGGAR